MTQISRFTGEIVPIAQVVTGDGDESAAPEGGGGFADYALVSLHCLRIYLDASYRMTIDLLKEMPQITGEIGLDAVRARSWFREFREVALMCVVYNIKHTVKQ